MKKYNPYKIDHLSNMEKRDLFFADKRARARAHACVQPKKNTVLLNRNVTAKIFFFLVLKKQKKLNIKNNFLKRILFKHETITKTIAVTKCNVLLYGHVTAEIIFFLDLEKQMELLTIKNKFL